MRALPEAATRIERAAESRVGEEPRSQRVGERPLVLVIRRAQRLAGLVAARQLGRQERVGPDVRERARCRRRTRRRAGAPSSRRARRSCGPAATANGQLAQPIRPDRTARLRPRLDAPQVRRTTTDTARPPRARLRGAQPCAGGCPAASTIPHATRPCAAAAWRRAARHARPPRAPSTSPSPCARSRRTDRGVGRDSNPAPRAARVRDLRARTSRLVPAAPRGRPSGSARREPYPRTRRTARTTAPAGRPAYEAAGSAGGGSPPASGRSAAAPRSALRISGHLSVRV